MDKKITKATKDYAPQNPMCTVYATNCAYILCVGYLAHLVGSD